MEGQYRFSVRKKLVVLTTIVSIITYSCSAFFLNYLYPYISSKFGVGEQLFTFGTMFLGIFWSGVLAYFAAGVVSKKLQQLEVVVHQAASGKIQEEVPISKSGDEIRSLGEAFNKMLASLCVMVLQINDNFKETNKHVEKISDVSNNAAIHTDSIAMTTYEIAQGADRSAISVQGVTESMEYLTSVSSQVRENANHSHKLTEEMVMVLNNSNDTVHQLVEDIKGLAKENQLSLNAVETLDQHAQEIGRIVGLVGSLSEQTNLLALNASIEAARAGEHGKGFAVVAEEVRNLADASGQAVQEITQLVNTVQSETVHVVKLMTKQVETANHAALEGGSVNEAVRNTTELVHEVERSAKTIAELSEKQQERIQQTTEQTQEVAAIAEETSAGTQQVAAAAEEQREMIKEIEDISKTLQLQAQMLKETIHQFTINEE